MNTPKKILLVEDEATLLTALRDFLMAEGFEILVAGDGERAIQMAVEDNPDLIMLDIILPKKDGYEVLDFLKKEQKTQKIPVILLTNLGGAEDIQKAFERGATTYLVKSDYKLEDIAKKIKGTLNIE
jgi:DNA-binding response OmpR family regulator